MQKLYAYGLLSFLFGLLALLVLTLVGLAFFSLYNTGGVKLIAEVLGGLPVAVYIVYKLGQTAEKLVGLEEK